eukprot:m.93735 g.93735  ORF g.93735 m.93735 type:complete len:423 (-) comp13409_c0_seq1:189-1457(-)
MFVPLVAVLVLTQTQTQTTPTPSICEAENGDMSSVRGPCPPQTKPIALAGANIFDAFWECSTGMNGPGTKSTSHAFQTATDNGIRVFRFFASLFQTSMQYWVHNETNYWNEFDMVIDLLETYNLYAIPSIGTDWHHVANAVTKGLNETTNDLIMNKSSVSRLFLEKYTTQLITRYKEKKHILLWELGNELNLRTNLPPPHCGEQQCFNTDAMSAFVADFVSIIRNLDGSRLISSGFSLPRSSAWHQEHCPLSGKCQADPSQGYWGVDSIEQFAEMLTLQQRHVDLWSIHHYADPHACYFSKDDCVNQSFPIINASTAAAYNAGKLLYVGEYGGPNPNFTGPSVANQEFPESTLNAQVTLSKTYPNVFALSTIWAWECPSHRQDMVCIWPNSTIPKESGSARMAKLIMQTNQKLLDNIQGPSS